MYSWKKIIMMISCMIMLVPLKSFASEDVPFEMLNYNLETKTVEEYTFKGNKVPDFCPGFEGTETENNNGRADLISIFTVCTTTKFSGEVIDLNNTNCVTIFFTK